MSTYSYKADQRGKLVTVDDKNSVRVFSAPQSGAVTQEFIDGPKTVGTATGKVYSDATFTWIEVLRVGVAVLGFPNITVIYLIGSDVLLKTNPAYDASKDTSAPNADGSVKGVATTPTGSTPSTDTDPSDVSETPGPDRVPVTASDGKTVYVLIPKPTDTTESGALTPDVSTSDTTRKYLTWGFYGVLGLGAITLVVILVISLSKPKKKS